MSAKRLLLRLCALLVLLFVIQSTVPTVHGAKSARSRIRAQDRSFKGPPDLVEQIARDEPVIRNCLKSWYDGDAAGLAKLLDVEQRDLNRDGKPEFLIIFKDACRGAFVAGPVFVYSRTAKGYVQLLSGFGRDFTVKKTVTNSYFDLQVGDIDPQRTNPAGRELTIYKFKRGSYQESECLTETYAGRRHGREIYRYKRHKC